MIDTAHHVADCLRLAEGTAEGEASRMCQGPCARSLFICHLRRRANGWYCATCNPMYGRSETVTQQAENSRSRAQEPISAPRRTPVHPVKIRSFMRMWSKCSVKLEQMERDNAARAQMGRPPHWSSQQLGDVRTECVSLARTIRDWLGEQPGV